MENTSNHLTLIDISRTLQWTIAEYTLFFRYMYGVFTGIEHVFDHKTTPHKFQKTENHQVYCSATSMK